MGKQIQQAARSIWLNIGVALLVLTLMEGAGEGYLVLSEPARGGWWREEQRYEPDPGDDQNWVPEYIRELTVVLENEWRPFVYWRTKPYRGKYVNIDEAGVRRIWHGTSSPVPGQLKVFMFGGSTLWGSVLATIFLFRRSSKKCSPPSWVRAYG